MTQSHKWSIGTAVLAVALLAASWFLLVSPKLAQAGELESQTDAQLAANEQLRTTISVLQEQAKDLPKEQAKLAAIQTKMPTAPALPGLIRQLSEAAQKSGVTLVALTPSTPVLLAEGAEAGTLPVGGVPGGEIGAIPVDLQLTGGFFEIQQFVKNLETLSRVFLVTAVNVSSSEDDPGVLTAGVGGQVFMVPDEATGTAPATTATTPAPAAGEE